MDIDNVDADLPSMKPIHYASICVDGIYHMVGSDFYGDSLFHMTFDKKTDEYHENIVSRDSIDGFDAVNPLELDIWPDQLIHCKATNQLLLFGILDSNAGHEQEKVMFGYSIDHGTWTALQATN